MAIECMQQTPGARKAGEYQGRTRRLLKGEKRISFRSQLFLFSVSDFGGALCAQFWGIRRGFQPRDCSAPLVRMVDAKFILNH